MADSPVTFEAAAARRRAARRSLAMWVAATSSLVALIVLLGSGRGDSAWSIAAAILIVSCVAVCSWAGYAANRDFDEMVTEAKRFVAQRQVRRTRS